MKAAKNHCMLNDLLADRLGDQPVHGAFRMCANWRYDKLHEAAEAQAITEMKHAEGSAYHFWRVHRSSAI
jgi:bacterioferritin (cytochrome b1)